MIGINSPETGQQKLTYDTANNLISHRHGEDNSTTYTYSATNKLTSAIRPDGQFTLDYDQFDRLLKIQGPSETTLYRYDAEGRKNSHTRIIDGHELTTRYQYNAIGQLVYKLSLIHI